MWQLISRLFYCTSNVFYRDVLCVANSFFTPWNVRVWLIIFSPEGHSSLLGTVLALRLQWICLTLSQVPWHSGRVELYLLFFISQRPCWSVMAHRCVLLSCGVSNNRKAFKFEHECHQSPVTWKEEERLKSSSGVRSLLQTPTSDSVTSQPTWGLTWTLAPHLCVLLSEVMRKAQELKHPREYTLKERGNVAFGGSFSHHISKNIFFLFLIKTSNGWKLRCPLSRQLMPLSRPTRHRATCVTHQPGMRAFLTLFCRVGSGKIVFPSYYIKSKLFQRIGWLVLSLGH